MKTPNKKIRHIISNCDLTNITRGIVVQVYRKGVSILAQYNGLGHVDSKTDVFGFIENSLSIGNYNTVSKTNEICISRSLSCSANKLYLFEDWNEFTKSAVKNNWK